MELAKEYYAYLRQYNRNADGTPKEQYMQPLEKYVLRDFKEDLTGFKSANMTIGAWIFRSLKQLSIGEVESSLRSMEIAKTGWKYYMTNKGIDPGRTGRRSLAPLTTMRAGAAAQFLEHPGIVPIHKIRLWRRLDLTTRKMIYDDLLDYFTELAASHEPPIILERAFPEPPGMEEYRARQPVEVREEEEIDQGEKAW